MQAFSPTYQVYAQLRMGKQDRQMAQHSHAGRHMHKLSTDSWGWAGLGADQDGLVGEVAHVSKHSLAASDAQHTPA